MVLYSHCLNCDKRLTKDEDMFCKECIKEMENNEKLQKLKREAMPIQVCSKVDK